MKYTKMSPHQVRRRKCSWSHLPPELLAIIFERMKAPSAATNFRVVCKSWRSSIPPPVCLSRDFDFLPQEISCDADPPTFVDKGVSFLLAPNVVYILRPCRDYKGMFGKTNWLVALEQTSHGKVRLLHPLTRLPMKSLPKDFPKSLYTSNAIALSKGFSLRFCDGITPVIDRKSSFSLNKVLLWPNPRVKYRSKNDCSVVLLHNSGDLLCFDIGTYKKTWNISYGQVSKFDDILHLWRTYWKDMILAVDRVGRLYGIEYQTIRVTTVLVAEPIFRGQGERRKRLFDWNNEVYLVTRVHTDTLMKCHFKVFKLNMMRHVWMEVKKFEDRVLFISSDTCFFTKTEDLSGIPGNRVVFPKNCFPAYTGTNKPDATWFKGLSDNLEVGFCEYSSATPSDFLTISSQSKFSELLWPPPQWIWDDTSTSYRNSADDEEEEVQMESHDQEAPNVCSSGGRTVVAASIKPCVNGATTMQFEDVEVRAELVPILQRIWAKHGDVRQGSLVMYRGNVARALESLAEVVLILLNNTGRSLNKSQVDDMSAVLLDLQRMHFKVEWLVPIVNKALACHQGTLELNQCLGEGLC